MGFVHSSCRMSPVQGVLMPESSPKPCACRDPGGLTVSVSENAVANQLSSSPESSRSSTIRHSSKSSFAGIVLSWIESNCNKGQRRKLAAYSTIENIDGLKYFYRDDFAVFRRSLIANRQLQSAIWTIRMNRSLESSSANTNTPPARTNPMAMLRNRRLESFLFAFIPTTYPIISPGRLANPSVRTWKSKLPVVCSSNRTHI